MKEQLEFEFTADTSDLKKKMQESRDDIAWFKKRVEDDEAIKLSLNVATIQRQINLLKSRLKAAKDSGDLQAEIEISADIERMKQSLTQSKRELRNYVRTGEKDLSVLGKLFDNVGSKIDQSRLELIKLGKSTKVLDDMERELNELNKNFKSGKISVQEYGAKMNQLEGKIQNAGKQTGFLKSQLKGLAGFLIAGLWFRELTKFAKESVLAFAEFEKGLARINSVAGVSQDSLKGLGNEIKDISVLYGQSKQELLDTAFNISSAGVEFQNVSTILKLSSVVAVGAATDTTTAFNGIIAVVKKYGEDLSAAGDIAEKFFIANKLGQTTIEELAVAIQNLSSTAKTAGVTIDTTFAVLSTLTGVTGDANKVITQLNGAINAIAAPTKEARKLFDELGIEVGQAAIKEKGFLKVIEDVYDATDGNIEVLRRLIPEVEAQKLIVALATEQNGKYRESIDQLSTSTGNLEQAVKQYTETTAFQLAVATEKFNNLKVGVGNALITAGAYVYDFGVILKSIFLWVVGGVFGAAGITLAGFVSLFINGMKDLYGAVKVVGSNIPLAFKAALNGLPGLFVRTLRAIIKTLPGGEFTDKLVGKLGLDKLQDYKPFGDGVEAPAFDFSASKSSIDTFLKQGTALKNGIQKELDVASNIIAGKGKVYDAQVSQVIESVQGLNQSFGAATDEAGGDLEDLGDTIDDTTSAADKLGAAGGSAAEKISEETKLAEEAAKDLEEKTKELEELREQQHKDTLADLKTEAKINGEVYDEIIDNIEGGIDAVEDYGKAIKDAREEIQELKDDSVESIRDINNELSNIESDKDTQLGERRLAILEEEKDLKKEIADLNSELANLDGDDTGQDQRDRLAEIDAQRIANAEELAIIERNASAETLKQIENYDKLSEAQKILLETEKARAEANERKGIYDAIANDEDIDLEGIENYDNLKLAESLIAKKAAAEQEIAIAQAGLDTQRDLLASYQEDLKNLRKEEADEYAKLIAGRVDLEKEFTEFMATEMRKRIQTEASIRENAGVVGAGIKELKANESGGSSVTKEYNLSFPGAVVRDEEDINTIVNAVYEKIELETEEGDKNYY